MLSERLVPPTVARLTASVAALGGRVKQAGDLAALMRSGQLQPQLAAWVIPAGLIGRPGNAVANAFVQPVDRGLSVVLSIPAYDGTGAGAGDQLEDLITAVVTAVAGWSPIASPGVLHLSRGQLLRMEGGIIVYQIDFSLLDQLRTSA